MKLQLQHGVSDRSSAAEAHHGGTDLLFGEV